MCVCAKCIINRITQTMFSQLCYSNNIQEGTLKKLNSYKSKNGLEDMEQKITQANCRSGNVYNKIHA